MRANEIINEKASRGRPIVAVDIQPAYMEYTPNDYKWRVAKFLAEQKAPMLMYINAEQEGLTEDNIDDVHNMWYELFEEVGYDFYEDGYEKMEFFDKGYGYLRGWMDIGIEPVHIIRTIREMYKQKVDDSRMLFDGEEKLLEFLRPIAESINTEPEHIIESPISVGWVAMDQLKRYNNCYLIGGGRDECLKEIAILMNAFNIKYKMIDSLIYG